jgi:glutamyl-tRNA reductase
MTDLPAELAAADLVIACTGATGPVVTTPVVEQALARRSGRPLALLDLALPRDIEARAGSLPGVQLIDLEAVGAAGTADGPAVGSAMLPGEADVRAVRRIVAHELAAYLQADRAASVAPTVVALRAKAATVVEAELARLERRLGDLDPKTRREIAQTMGRIADKLLHGPTVRVKELAGSGGADSYETALRVLFELDPEAVQAVERADDELLAWSLREATE